jgi:hypothetical protein
MSTELFPWMDKLINKDFTLKNNGKIIVTSTPKMSQSDFAREYLGEWVNDRPTRIVSDADLEEAVVKYKMTLEEVLEVCPVGIDRDAVKRLYAKFCTEAWRLLYG